MSLQPAPIHGETYANRARRYAEAFEESSDTILFADLHGSPVTTNREVASLLRELADKLDEYNRIVLDLMKDVPRYEE